MKAKTFFTILDFVGATKLFYDPKWDGEKIEELKEQDEKEKITKEHIKQTKEESKEKKERNHTLKRHKT